MAVGVGGRERFGARLLRLAFLIFGNHDSWPITNQVARLILSEAGFGSIAQCDPAR